MYLEKVGLKQSSHIFKVFTTIITIFIIMSSVCWTRINMSLTDVILMIDVAAATLWASTLFHELGHFIAIKLFSRSSKAKISTWGMYGITTSDYYNKFNGQLASESPELKLNLISGITFSCLFIILSFVIVCNEPGNDITASKCIALILAFITQFNNKSDRQYLVKNGKPYSQKPKIDPDSIKFGYALFMFLVSLDVLLIILYKLGTMPL